MVTTAQEVTTRRRIPPVRICPICGEQVRELVADHKDFPAGACTHCIDQRDATALKKSGFVPAHVLSRMGGELTIFPTPLRLNADPAFTGNGVTICFIDSGFHPHPDLLCPSSRVLCTVDIAAGQTTPGTFGGLHDDQWHGTMTSVVCAGNGFLSNGFYAGIAPKANLVLLKVKNERGISGENITRAIRWAIEHREQYGIRIINLSVTDDEPVSYKQSLVDQAAEEAIAAGIVVVAAVGNDPTQPVKPPANSPGVIAIGGVDDHNTLGMTNETIYHSTYGITVDQFLKPELIAPSIWLAAPILPKTPAHEEAGALHAILDAKEPHLKAVAAKQLDKAGLDSSLLQSPSVEAIKNVARQRLAEKKFISVDYMHADGTSFAAPIVCSVVAQMLEANPGLTPAAVRHILLTTARKLEHVPVERQGYGVLNPRAAVAMSIDENHLAPLDFPGSPVIDTINGKIIFYYHNDHAHTVALAGSFNMWNNGHLFTRNGRGIWKAELPMLPRGTHHYKFIVDHRQWIADPGNLYREPDGFNGLNSRIVIE